jgi:YVTN family beta-propeller protein
MTNGGIISCFLVLTIEMSLSQVKDTEFSLFVGQQVCLSCHNPNGGADTCSLEPIAKHNQAYEALHISTAKEIAALCGEAQTPQESRLCLGCHATSADVGRRWSESTFDIRDGVQCEACHDAGSLHVQAYRSTSQPSDLPGHYSIRRGDRSSCRECHMDRPSHREVLVNGFRRLPSDEHYKTPVNLVSSKDGKTLYVVCEHSNSVMAVDAQGCVVVCEISVGKRPHDAALSSDGGKLYVSNRLSGTLSVIDTTKRRLVGEIPVGAEPHGVLIDREGRFVYVLNAAGDSISVVDVEQEKEIKRLSAGIGPYSAALSPDGTTICVTNVRPQRVRFRDPHYSEITLISTRLGVVTNRPRVSDANLLQGIAFVPDSQIAFFTMARTKNLVPLTRLAQGWSITNGLGVLWPDGRVDQVLLDELDRAFPDPMDVTVSPDGRHALVTSGGCDEIAVVDVAALLATITSSSEHERQDVLPNHLGKSGRFVLKRIRVGTNPRGLVFSPDGRCVYVANSLDDSVTVLDAGTFAPSRVIRLGGPEETTHLRQGEKLFHSASKTFGRQFSCRSCHPDGHTNGLTFDIEADRLGMNPVDNRTLRGILDTPPFKWEGINPSLHRQCGPRLAVFFTRLAPFTADELNALVHYISTIERPSNPHRSPDGLTLAQRRGKAVFERTTTNDGRPIPAGRRCNDCHNSPYMTARNMATVGTTMWFDREPDLASEDLFDTESFGVFGVAYFFDTGTKKKRFDTPHLNNIFDSAPYLHNGAASSLEEIWTRFNIYEGHGITGDLTRRQLNDLIAYLKSS